MRRELVLGTGVGPSMAPRPMQQGSEQNTEVAERVAEKNKPEGPLIIAISIQHQHLRVYDINGFYAESPVSTGMAGHSTPMGVFSILEKQRWHRSNIYSGAQIFIMQRITWSGVAMHQGILPGYAASHGCIRMPAAFAVKLWAVDQARRARDHHAPGDIAPADLFASEIDRAHDRRGTGRSPCAGSIHGRPRSGDDGRQASRSHHTNRDAGA